MNWLIEAFYIFFFPGFLFAIAYGFFMEWFDRKLYAKMQDRLGPPFLQPLADFIKLLSKEDIVPKAASKALFNYVPVLSLAFLLTAFLYIPIFSNSSPLGFNGDMILVLYLKTLPSILLFVGGWHSGNAFSSIGAYRELSMVFVYEVAFFAVILSPVLITGSWAFSDLAAYQQSNPWFFILQPIGFVVALMCLQAKLGRVPFDMPEAEAEIVGGPFTEYSGKKLALFRLCTNMTMVVGSALIAVVFLGGPSLLFDTSSLGWPAMHLLGFAAFLIKTLFVIFILSVVRSAFARIRIDQMVFFGWKWLGLLALLQIAATIILKMVGVF
ncbi:MAG: NADH-quinone oxidoreductase subunit H [Candidatus Diapherotrites archaeon]|nr:NADH-quinone oxidoreductase subunit H [Candidatus Diapherotrites archaeon]